MDPLHATLEELQPTAIRTGELPPLPRDPASAIDQLPKVSMGLTLDALARRLRCAKCGGPLLSVKPWRQADASRETMGTARLTLGPLDFTRDRNAPYDRSDYPLPHLNSGLRLLHL